MSSTTENTLPLTSFQNRKSDKVKLLVENCGSHLSGIKSISLYDLYTVAYSTYCLFITYENNSDSDKDHQHHYIILMGVLYFTGSFKPQASDLARASYLLLSYEGIHQIFSLELLL